MMRASLGWVAAGVAVLAVTMVGGAASAQCSDPSFPTYCSRSDSCWTPATSCSTLSLCGGTWVGCQSGYTVDCSRPSGSRCVESGGGGGICDDPRFPVYCSEDSDCWTYGTDCSTIRTCSGDDVACDSGYHVDCSRPAGNRCVEGSPGGCSVSPGGGSLGSSSVFLLFLAGLVIAWRRRWRTGIAAAGLVLMVALGSSGCVGGAGEAVGDDGEPLVADEADLAEETVPGDGVGDESGSAPAFFPGDGIGVEQGQVPAER